ncbi:MAG: hypothetical protein HRT71_08390 [Flavobacteriales bacterium]|nr:hypothetical protein [Flavobacteriales bacterium]
MAFGIYFLKETIDSRLIITEYSIKSETTFRNREILLKDIKGYKTDEQFISIVPKNQGEKSIKISSYVGNYHELVIWIQENFIDLYAENELKEESEIMTNNQYGNNKEEREANFKQAKNVARIINYVGVGLIVWVLFKPIPYELSVIACIALPIIAILITIMYKGLIKIDRKKGSASPSVMLGLTLAICGLFMRALLDFNILDYSNIWLPSLLIAVVAVSLIIFQTQEYKFTKAIDYFSVASLLLVFFGYGFGSVVSLNGMFDKSIPTHYEATITDMRISTGKKTSYYLELSPWGTRVETEDVEVSENLYNILSKEEVIDINVKNGNLGIPWFNVFKK